MAAQNQRKSSAPPGVCYENVRNQRASSRQHTHINSSPPSLGSPHWKKLPSQPGKTEKCTRSPPYPSRRRPGLSFTWPWRCPPPPVELHLPCQVTGRDSHIHLQYCRTRARGVNSSRRTLSMDPGGKPGSWAVWPDLAEFRRSRKLTLQQIAARTNIGADYLTAIEQGDLDKLPGGLYATSFIRQYARMIDYPEQDLLAVFHASLAASTPARVEYREESSPGSSLPGFIRWLSSRVF
jgi:hypothetical protein